MGRHHGDVRVRGSRAPRRDDRDGVAGRAERLWRSPGRPRRSAVGRYFRGGLQFLGVGPRGRPHWHTPDRHAGGVGRLLWCFGGHRFPRFLGFYRGGCGHWRYGRPDGQFAEHGGRAGRAQQAAQCAARLLRHRHHHRSSRSDGCYPDGVVATGLRLPPGGRGGPRDRVVAGGTEGQSCANSGVSCSRQRRSWRGRHRHAGAGRARHRGSCRARCRGPCRTWHSVRIWTRTCRVAPRASPMGDRCSRSRRVHGVYGV